MQNSVVNIGGTWEKGWIFELGIDAIRGFLSGANDCRYASNPPLIDKMEEDENWTKVRQCKWKGQSLIKA